MLPLQPVIDRACIFSVKYSSCGKMLIGGSNDGQIYMFDRERNKQTKRIPLVSTYLFYFDFELFMCLCLL